MTLVGYIVFLNMLLFAVLVLLTFLAFLSGVGDTFNPLIVIPALLIGIQLAVGFAFFDKEYTLVMQRNTTQEAL